VCRRKITTDDVVGRKVFFIKVQLKGTIEYIQATGAGKPDRSIKPTPDENAPVGACQFDIAINHTTTAIIHNIDGIVYQIITFRANRLLEQLRYVYLHYNPPDPYRNRTLHYTHSQVLTANPESSYWFWTLITSWGSAGEEVH
jgi:hypothetical protein